jgi:hypothetical protein
MGRFKTFDARGRLARVLAKVRQEPTGAMPTAQVRIKLGALPAPLRAIVRNESNGGMLIEAELPWLTVGSEIQAEMPDGREKAGRVHWFGMDATSAEGAARLRIFVDLSATSKVPVKLPDVAELSGRRSKRWPWVLATLVLMAATAIVVYTLARRPAPTPTPPPPASVQQPAPPAPATTPNEPAPAPTEAVTPPPAKAAPAHAKPKRKRR